MRLVVDGVFFSLSRSGIARVWETVLRRLVSYPDLEIVLLDRGDCPQIAGVRLVEFPSYAMNSLTASDSLLLDEFCRELEAEVFMSTYYTTPVSIPSVLMVYDMIPEVLNFNLSARPWQEKEIAISFARYFACISETTRRDLSRFYPEIGARSIVTRCGIDREMFHPRSQLEVEAFKERYRISKPYYLLVGSREQAQGYKNGALVFQAAGMVRGAEFEILCAGGEKQINRDALDELPPRVGARRLELTDDELACAYTGAEALIYPSLYEGFGMPVIEAMGCDCPVICTRRGALAEITKDAALFISGGDRRELGQAMSIVREPQRRTELIEGGRRWAVQHDWQPMVETLHDLVHRAGEEGQKEEMTEFFDQWRKLRSIQAEVDTYQS